MDQILFDKYRALIERESGIHLTDEKRELLNNRLLKRLRALGLRDPIEYFTYLERSNDGEELVNLIDAISTNVTYFYREPEHFEFFGKLMERYKEEKRTRVRIWCAASSTGEEPYTLAMIVRHVWGTHLPDVKILATDICTRVLTVATQGHYEESAIQRLPTQYRSGCLKLVDTESGPRWSVADSARNILVFRKMNLSRFPYALKGPLDVIFCRNVLFYFDRTLRGKIVTECEKLLSPGGYLVLSHSENMIGISHNLTTEQVAVYRK